MTAQVNNKWWPCAAAAQSSDISPMYHCDCSHHEQLLEWPFNHLLLYFLHLWVIFLLFKQHSNTWEVSKSSLTGRKKRASFYPKIFRSSPYWCLRFMKVAFCLKTLSFIDRTAWRSPSCRRSRGNSHLLLSYWRRSFCSSRGYSSGSMMIDGPIL